MLLTARGTSLRIKGKIYRACVQRVLPYGSETWSMKVDDMQRLGIKSVDRVVSRGRLRWFGHVERKEDDDWVSKCRNWKVEGGIRKGRGRKTWIEGVTTDMKKFGLKKEAAQNRSVWSSSIVGNV